MVRSRPSVPWVVLVAGTVRCGANARVPGPIRTPDALFPSSFPPPHSTSLAAMAAPVPKVRMMNGLPMDKNGHLLKRPVVYDRLPRVNWAEVAGPWLAEEFLDFDRQHGLTKERVMRRLRREPPRTTEAALPEPPTSPELAPCVVTSTGRASAGATKTATTTVKMPTPTSSADLSSARGRRRARWRLKDMKCTVVDPADRVLVFARRRAPRTAMPRVVRVQASEPFVCVEAPGRGRCALIRTPTHSLNSSCSFDRSASPRAVFSRPRRRARRRPSTSSSTRRPSSSSRATARSRSTPMRSAASKACSTSTASSRRPSWASSNTASRTSRERGASARRCRKHPFSRTSQAPAAPQTLTLTHTPAHKLILPRGRQGGEEGADVGVHRAAARHRLVVEHAAPDGFERGQALLHRGGRARQRSQVHATSRERQ